MKTYAVSIRITGLLTIITVLLACLFHYGFNSDEFAFWVNVSLGVFGSSLLTLITSCVGYSAEKKRTLEGFWYSTRDLIRAINKYDYQWETDEKVRFFLDYADIDKTVWDMQLGSFYFFYDKGKKDFDFIYKSIYRPIIEFNQEIGKHNWHFRMHLYGKGKNDAVMAEFVKEIEESFLEKATQEISLENGKEVSASSVRNKLVQNVTRSLNGRYFDIMCGKRNKKEND